MLNRQLLVAAFIALPVTVATAQDRLIEEIVVTAQRIEEDASKVPMSVSAFTDAMIEDRQIIGVSDLQINVPNFSFTQENFGGARVTIRGIGDAPAGELRATASPSVPIHINGISAPVDVSVIEFYDLERIEVLRGPQGTLYGRNATGGAMNFVTRRPDFSAFGGYVDLEYGDYDHTRLKGAINVPITDQLALRAAGMTLERDGYIENKAAGQIPGIDDDLDGRDFYTYRITAEWQPTDTVSAWVTYSRFDEDDSKVRATNQVCRQSTLPNLGCEADSFGMDAVHPVTVAGGLFAQLAGAVPFGARDEETGLDYEFPRPHLDLREQHTDFNPVFEFEEDAWLLGVDWAFDPLTLSLGASYFDTSRLSQQDYNMDVGYVLNATPQNPSGLWPVSAPSGPPGALRGGGPCDVERGLAGVFGPCTLSTELNRNFYHDRAGEESEFVSVEIRTRSNLEGRINFLLGANYLDIDIETDYYVMGNGLDLVGLYGLPVLGVPQLYPSLFNEALEREIESYSAFGELYVDLTAALKLTFGVRYQYDELQRDQANGFYNAFNVTPFLPPGTVSDPTWVRGDMTGYLFGAPDPAGVALADYYGASTAIENATGLEELVAVLQMVPLAPQLSEYHDLVSPPGKADWDDINGRIGLDWAASDDKLLYAFYTQGYRPGGFVLESSHDSEHVNAFEVGAKTLWASGSFRLDSALFFNDYDDKQLWGQSDIGPRTENVDAETIGFELAAQWRPAALSSLTLELDYAWLDTEIKNGQSLDFYNRTQGDPSLVNLRDPDVGGLFQIGYTAPIADVLPLVDAAITAQAAIPALGAYDNGVPVYFSRAYLAGAGVPVAEGVPAVLDGKELPNSPRHSIRLGAAHTWSLLLGALTVRYDYYWQDSSYGREFNTRGDEIDSWDQHNASLIFESANGRWSARAWIRNITDEEIVTGHFATNDTAGNFRNYFLAEPRIYGASLRYNFGAI